MPGRRLLFIVGGTRVYGAERAMLELMCGLHRRGHRVHCVVSGWNDGHYISLLEHAAIPYTPVHLGFVYLRKPSWTLATLRHYPGALRAFRSLLKALRPELIVHVSPRTVLALYPLLRSARNVLVVHDVQPANRRTRLVFVLAGRKIRKYAAVSDDVQRSLVRLRIPEKAIRVIPNGISISAGMNSGPARERFPCAVGIVGQIIPRKGHEVLIEALRLLAGDGVPFHCVIVGDGDPVYRSRLESLVERYGLGARVTWTGYIGDQDAIYRQIDVLVVPSLQEPFGLVAAEGAARGLPVVASRVGGLTAVVREGLTGFLAEPGDPRALASKLRILIQNPELRREMGRAGREYVTRHFSADLMCERFEQFLSTVG
ncbi:MAG: hypothetical protein KatS3mg082_3132 [Nitrospiraceae bacterium]|nr:MAG: hypothetical protein KatS3mg082_3132 [Nitrospiraceae bacterium]